MKTRKIIALTIAVVAAAALIAAGLAIAHQAANTKNKQAVSTNAAMSTGLSLDHATVAVQNYLSMMGYSNLGVKMMQEYSNLYYAQVVEQNNGTGAFELAVNKTTGLVTPMQGPTLIWNTKYGVSSTGMMGYLLGTNPSGKGMMKRRRHDDLAKRHTNHKYVSHR